MTFRIGIELPDLQPDLDFVDLTISEENPPWMVFSEILARVGCTFVVGGFGEDTWSVDVPYDLSMFLDDLPHTLRSVRSQDRGEFSFPGQGIERYVRFEAEGRHLRLTCVSLVREPKRAEESFPRSEIVEQLEGLARTIVDVIEGCSVSASVRAAIAEFRVACDPR